MKATRFTPRLAGWPAFTAPSATALTLATAAAALGAALLLGLTLAAPAHADPMRPLVPPVANANPAASTAPPASTAAAAAPLPTLQALRRDEQGRQQALFGEQWLAVGDRVGDRVDSGPRGVTPTTVASIQGNSVQLQQGRQRHTLHLLPPLQYSAEAASAAASVGHPAPPSASAAAPRAAASAPVSQRAAKRRQP